MNHLLALEYLHRAVSSFDKQLHLADLIGDSNWRIDLSTGLLHIGDRFQWDVQLLGTESSSTQTWLWAWGNEVSRFAEELCGESLALKTLGEEYRIPELALPEIPLSHVDGHMLALIASGVCEANAYYRCHHDGGALFVLIKDSTFPACAEPSLVRVASVFPQAIASLDLPDHQIALEKYLGFYGFATEAADRRVIARNDGEVVLTATFDESNRLAKLNVVQKPEPPTAGESWDEMQLRRMLGW